MKLADCFYSWLYLFIAFAFMSSAMSMYAKVTNTKLDNDISAFEKKVGKRFTI